jgi:hypothetical protein
MKKLNSHLKRGIQVFKECLIVWDEVDMVKQGLQYLNIVEVL